LAPATRTNENGEAGGPTSPSEIKDTFGYGVQVPVVHCAAEEEPPIEFWQAALSVTGELPGHVMVEVVPSLVPDAMVAPDPFLTVRVSVPVALAPISIE
jgi:hypothetical protein